MGPGQGESLVLMGDGCDVWLHYDLQGTTWRALALEDVLHCFGAPGIEGFVSVVFTAPQGAQDEESSS
jgi:hypothetical protein